MKRLITRELTKSAQIQKRFGVLYMCIVGLMWGIGICRFPSGNVMSLGFLLLVIAFWVNIYSFIMMIIISLDTVKRLLPIYIVGISILLFPSLLMSRFLHSNDFLLWIMVCMISISVVYSSKKAFFWNAFLFIQVTLAIILAKIFGENIFSWLGNDLQNAALHLIFENNIFNIIALFLLFLCAIYHKIQYKKALQKESYAGNEDKEPQTLRSDEQYFKLYEQIVRYFDEKKPYLNATFSASTLADVLNSNSTYISQAIKVHKKMNFNTFVNIYRVKKAIQLMQEDDEKKYTLQYIYQEAGFQSQTTFNRVFKQITGFTPSDYLSKEQ